MEFKWAEKEQKAFDTLKQALVSPKLLLFPDYNKKFILTCDGCKTGMGYVLQQEDDKGVVRPIAYAGRATSDSEIFFSISELELAALISGLRYFQSYLTHSHTVIETDHAAINYILKDKRPATQRIARWLPFLSSFDFKIVARHGVKVGHDEALSRRK